jgi:hypothetical protein
VDGAISFIQISPPPVSLYGTQFRTAAHVFESGFVVVRKQLCDFELHLFFRARHADRAAKTRRLIENPDGECPARLQIARRAAFAVSQQAADGGAVVLRL